MRRVSTKAKHLAKLSLTLDSLPTLPGAAAEILRVANNPSAGSMDLEVLIARDPALTAQALQVANSPVYGFRRRLSTVHETVVALGTRKIRAIASALALAPSFKDGAGGLLKGTRLWSHALASALWTQEIAPRVDSHDLNRLFTAALMHDIGIVVLSQVASERYGDLLSLAQEAGASVETVEQDLLETNHARIGAAVCAKWMLPAELTLLIAHHHSHETPIDPSAQVLALADWLASTTGCPNFEWESDARLPEGLVSAMGLRGGDIEDLRARAPEIRERADAFAN
jgi:putative nucleotidyltransferase with HDIG domain